MSARFQPVTRCGFGVALWVLVAASACQHDDRGFPDTSASAARRAPARPAPRAGTSSGATASAGATPASDSAAEAGWRGAAGVVRRYYAAIDSGDYAAAYAMWGDGGRSSGQSRAEFEAGFAGTASVRVAIGDSTGIEGAAGSRYATVPVTVEARQRDGTLQRFTGSYTVRRVVVDGATPAQRRWHLDSAHLTPAR